MIDVYEIRFQDSGSCIIKICQEDGKGNAIAASSVCLRYKESWEAVISEHIASFFKKHSPIKTFEEHKDNTRLMTVYSFVTEDDSGLTVDAIDKVQEMEQIIQTKKYK